MKVPNQDLDSWFEHFRAAAKELGVVGKGGYSAQSDGTWSRFRYSDLPEIFGCACECESTHLLTQSAEEVATLRPIADRATESLNAGKREYHWFGTIILQTGSSGGAVKPSDEVHLDNNLTVYPLGPVQINRSVYRPAAGTSLPVEWSAESMPGTTHFEYDQAYEVAVHGLERQYSWTSTETVARKTLSDLANTISVLYDVMAQPEPYIRQVNADSFPSVPDLLHTGRDHASAPDRFTETPMSPGLSQAWVAAKEPGSIRNAVGMMSEAISLHRSNPSIAHFACVAAIEAIGQALSPPTECQGTADDASVHCEACQRKTGAMSAFTTAIETVASRETARELKKTAYVRRSQTGHDAALHGGEGGQVLPFTLTGQSDHAEFMSLRVRTHRIALQVVRQAMAGSNTSVQRPEQGTQRT